MQVAAGPLFRGLGAAAKARHKALSKPVVLGQAGVDHPRVQGVGPYRQFLFFAQPVQPAGEQHVAEFCGAVPGDRGVLGGSRQVVDVQL